MKNLKIKTIAVAAVGATSFALAGPAAHAAEVTEVNLDSYGNTCRVEFTDREKANFGRIQVQAAKDYIAAYDANKSSLLAMQRDFIDAQSKLDANSLTSTHLGQSLPEAEKSALTARAEKAENEWYAWVDADRENREEFRYALRTFSRTLGEAQFAVVAQNNTNALFKEFVEGRGNQPKGRGAYMFDPINEKFTANDELSMYYSVDLPERSTFRPNEKITSAMETFLTALHAPHSLVAQYACAQYAKTFTNDHPLAGELEDGKYALSLGFDSGNGEYDQAKIRVPKIEALIAQGTVPTDAPAYFISEKLNDATTGDVTPTKPQDPSLPNLPGSNDADGVGGIIGIITAILGVLGLLAALIPNLSQLLNFGNLGR